MTCTQQIIIAVLATTAIIFAIEALVLWRWFRSDLSTHPCMADDTYPEQWP